MEIFVISVDTHDKQGMYVFGCYCQMTLCSVFYILFQVPILEQGFMRTLPIHSCFGVLLKHLIFVFMLVLYF